MKCYLNYSSFHTSCFASKLEHSKDLALTRYFMLEFDFALVGSSSFFFTSCKNWMADSSFKLCFISLHIQCSLFQCCLTLLSNIIENSKIETLRHGSERSFFQFTNLFACLENLQFAFFMNLYLIFKMDNDFSYYLHNYTVE